MHGTRFQKPYKCEVLGCPKRYTDPSSLRKHVKSHSTEEQLQYRRFKDQINAQKAQQQQQQQGGGPAMATVSEDGGGRDEEAARSWAEEEDNKQQQQASASTLLAVGLQAGGTMVDMGTHHQPEEGMDIKMTLGGHGDLPAAGRSAGPNDGGGGGGLQAQTAEKKGESRDS